MNSTKTILIGKKKKNIFKKENIDDFLNEYIPRFTEEDIPENDLLIDNSFELKQYTSKKKTSLEQEIKITPCIEPIPITPIVEKKEESLEQEVTITPDAEPIPITPIVEKPIVSTIQSINNLQLQVYPKVNNTIVPYTINDKPNINNFENIVYNYNNKKKHTSKPFDTMSTHSSIIDIMSLADINLDQLTKIKTNITNTNKKKQKIYTPSYNKKLIHSKKLHKLNQQMNNPIYFKSNDYKKHNHYSRFYKKYYTSIKNKEMIYNKNEQKKLNNSVKKIKIKDISTIRQILFTHKIISKKDIDMPEFLILDLYAMLCDTNCKFKIKQFT